MRKFVLDTNLYIYAFRSVAGAKELAHFLTAFGPAAHLSSVVLHELLVGAKTPAKSDEIRKRVAGPLERAGRVVTPTHGAWETAADAIARMARVEKRDLRSVPKSLVNDYLLAASCREAGVTLITRDVADFAEIRRHFTFDFVEAWPAWSP